MATENPLGAPEQVPFVQVTESESGAFLNLGRAYSLTLNLTVDAVAELETSWSEVRCRVERWRQKQGERARDVTIWYTVPDNIAPAAKSLLGKHLVCHEEPEFVGMKVLAFVVNPQGGFFCEIGLPNLD